jgi:prepilin-type N-terminal cleavage/methylation domain-containing protein
MLHNPASLQALRRRGFTLVELLVVITIIGLLIGMLLPAINSARESARNATCKNNLLQMGKAILAHEQIQEMFPTGGWGYNWLGDPDRGYGNQQPGGWIFNILPHIDQTNIHDMARYQTGSAKQLALVGTAATPGMVQLALPFSNCPSRRRQAVYPYTGGSTMAMNAGGGAAPSGLKVAKSDYAILSGDYPSNGAVTALAGPTAGADTLTAAGGFTPNAIQAAYFTGTTTNIANFHGICYQQSSVRKDDVRDGLTQTIMLGEKYLDPNAYTTGTDKGDELSLYTGVSNDLFRMTGNPPVNGVVPGQPPMQDHAGVSDVLHFGSAHPSGANFILCDGAAIAISYTVDPETFRRLGTAAENLPVDMTKLGVGGG